MPRKKKTFQQSVTFPTKRVQTSDTISGGLRSLIQGLFNQQKPYQPTQQEIVEYFLTPREREIAYLAALGFSVYEIADALGMNFQTVRQHVHNILKKLQLDDPRDLREFFSSDGGGRDP